MRSLYFLTFKPLIHVYISVVSNARWNPTYELHASTENGKPSSSVKLHYRARVTQETGEDWKNTSLTLNTVMSDTMVKFIPQLKQRKIRPKARGLFGAPSNNLFGQPVNAAQQRAPAPSSGLFGASATPSPFGASSPQAYPQQQSANISGFGSASFGQGFGGGSLFGGSSQGVSQAPEFPKTTGARLQGENTSDDGFEEVDNASLITENKTVVSETPVALSFSVQGESTIPSDGIEHQVSVAELTSAAKISYITIPRADARVYLQVRL